MGNLGSIQNMLKKIGNKALISSEISDIENADKLILPGVGAFDNGIKNLEDMGIKTILEKKVIKNKTPILGICLGMQLFTKRSEEGVLPGLGFIDAETLKFKFDENNKLKIPHMGWNNIMIKKENYIFKNMFENSRFYFVHSYHVVCNDENDVLANTNYGYDFVSVFRKKNILGVQFHPKKSHKFGMQLLKNFVEE